MSPKKASDENIKELYKVIAALNSIEDCAFLFEDLCTNNEIEQMTQRFIAAKLLLQGKTYSQVIEETDISSATLSRVSNAVKYGKGYKKFIK